MGTKKGRNGRHNTEAVLQRVTKHRACHTKGIAETLRPAPATRDAAVRERSSDRDKIQELTGKRWKSYCLM